VGFYWLEYALGSTPPNQRKEYRIFMNRIEKFKRVSAVIWSVATLFGCWLVFAAFQSKGVLVGFLALPVLVVPFGMHKGVCWVLDGFAP
jgi:hypothetical protein